MVTEERMKELIEIKNKQRAAFKAEYIKKFTDPHIHARGEGGSIVDAGISRWMAMEATTYHFFKPNVKNAIFGFCTYILPVAITMYFVKTDRDAREKLFRTGQISYRDREYKFI